MTLLEAVDEMYRRSNQIAVAGNLQAGDDMPVIEARIHFTDLNVPDVLANAERIARGGRKTNVTLVVSVPDDGHPRLDWFGGSSLLRETAIHGRSIRLEPVR